MASVLLQRLSRRYLLHTNFSGNKNMAPHSAASADVQPAVRPASNHSLQERDNVVDEQKWDEMLQILGSLIAFKNRADALGWRDAFENMPIYLEVGRGPTHELFYAG